MLRNTLKVAFYNFLSEKKAVKKIIAKLNWKELEFKNLPLKYRNNKEIATRAISEEKDDFQYVSTNLQNDIDIVLLAISKEAKNITFANDRFKTDEQLVMSLLKKNGLILEYLSSEFKNSIPFAIAAINQNVKAFNYVDDKLKQTKEVLLLALENYPSYFKKVPTSLVNKEFVIEAIEANIHCFHYIPLELQQDENVMLLIIKKDANAYTSQYIVGKLDTIQFTIKALFVNTGIISKLSLTKSIHPQIKWLKRNIDNINPEHKEYIKDTFLKYPNAFLYPDDIVKALMLGTPEDYLIMAHYAIAKYDKTKHIPPISDEDINFIPD